MLEDAKHSQANIEAPLDDFVVKLFTKSLLRVLAVHFENAISSVHTAIFPQFSEDIQYSTYLESKS